MSSPRQHRSGTPWAGIILIVLGGLFLLDTLDIMDFGDVIGDWWPLVLIVIGLLKLRDREKTGALFFLLFGLVFLGATLDFIEWYSIGQLWPLILIFIGLMLLWRGTQSRNGQYEESGDTVRARALFGGVERAFRSANFRGGLVEVMFGGVELDLRNSQLAPEGATLDITAMFGGAEITIPGDWRVEVTGTPILGGIENKTGSGAEPGGPLLACRCTVAFGGIEIRE